MNYKLIDLIDIKKFQHLFDSFCVIVGIPTAILDLEGNILFQSHWNEICTRFHRVNKQTAENCLESDTHLANAAQSGKSYTMYSCKNGLTDAASPIIIEGQHVANVFVGQFLLTPPDLEYFRQQANKFGFDESVYLKALSAIPVIDKEKLPSILIFLTTFAETLANIGLERIHQLKYQEEIRIFKTITETANYGIIICDIRGIIIFVNRFFCDMHGYQETELLCKEYSNLHSPDNLEFQHALFFKTIEQGTVGPVEVTGKKKDGTRMPLLLNSVCILNEDGKPIYVVASMIEISEMKKTEKILRDSEIRFRNLFNNVHEAIFIHDVDGRILDVNETVLDLYQVTKNEIKGASINSDFSSPDNPFGDLPGIWESVLNGNTATFEWKARRPHDGCTFDVEVHLKKIQYGEQEVILANVRDITFRKQAENSLRKEKERMQTYLDVAGVIFVALDVEGFVTLINKKGREILGFTEMEILSKPWFKTFVLPEHYEIAYANFKHLITAEIESDGYIENDILTRNSEKRNIAWHTAILKDDQGKVIGTLSSGEDITERKKIEAQLFQSQKMEAIGLLAGGIAHDFNNLLTAIIGSSEMVLRYTDSLDPRYHLLKSIKKAGDCAASLTRQLLAFSRKQIMETKILDLNALILNLDKILRRLIGENIDYRTLIDPALNKIKADPGQIEQILMNLVLNARDAMPDGGNLVIETMNVEVDDEYLQNHPENNPGDYVMFSVSDTGHGMNKKVMEHIFEPFFTTKEKGKGTGLGLSTVYGIVKQSNGFIYTYSEEGMGTVFKVYLPKAVSEEISSLRSEKSKPDVPNGHETILVVEDEELVRSMIIALLEDYGYKILDAPNGEEAFRIAASYPEKIDLLVTDVILPKQSGKEVALRLVKERPDLKVLFMSGYTENSIVHHGVLEEGINFIQKPFANQVFIQKISTILLG